MDESTVDTYSLLKPWKGTGIPSNIISQRNPYIELEHLKCGRRQCRNVLKEPLSLTCGHRYCKECVDLVDKSEAEIDKFCHACINEQLMSLGSGTCIAEATEADLQSALLRLKPSEYNKACVDKAGAKEVNKLPISCPWKCGQKGLKVRQLESHILQCPNRGLKCESCHTVVEYNLIKEHNNMCQNRLEECPNSCGQRLPRRDIGIHRLMSCPNTPDICRLCNRAYEGPLDRHMMDVCSGPCPYGCAGGKAYEKIIEHLSDATYNGKHMLCLMEELLSLESALTSEQFDEAAMVAMKQKIDSFMSDLTDAEHRLNEPAIKDLIQTIIDTNETKKVTALIKNINQTLSSLEHGDGASVSLDEVSEASSGVLLLVLNEVEKRLLQLTDYCNNTLQSIEWRTELAEAEMGDAELALDEFYETSYDGHLLWRVDGVEKLREEAKKGERFSLFSPPFYTSRSGYKMCLRLYLNGDGNGKGSHVALFFVVMQGEYDNLLSWPFQLKVTMKLVNQLDRTRDRLEKFRPEPSSSSFEKPKNRRNIASGCPTFVHQSCVFNDSEGFVVDDTMFLEAEIEV